MKLDADIIAGMFGISIYRKYRDWNQYIIGLSVWVFQLYRYTEISNISKFFGNLCFIQNCLNRNFVLLKCKVNVDIYTWNSFEQLRNCHKRCFHFSNYLKSKFPSNFHKGIFLSDLTVTGKFSYRTFLHNRPHYLCFCLGLCKKWSVHRHVCTVFFVQPTKSNVLVQLPSRDIIQWLNENIAIGCSSENTIHTWRWTIAYRREDGCETH
jgi:hypothetical protein